MKDDMEEKVDQLVNYIMKNCLWQFNSRAWDRENQNEGILKRTMQVLCDEPVEKDTPAGKYYWAEAVYLARLYKSEFKWINDMSKEEIKVLIKKLKEKIDYLTISGSLNEELKNPLY
ncbi:Fe-only nitrogenase subunit delta [Sporolactobacillus shoreicorticis]|uniref:Nitrogenase iron-iron protein delta chain n=1 Tax=Sporolactobacillus shoreicorticis TaxID=1923877 RepID=A0ABW5RXI7_9BACL|nr:Fe-only nitrogenase subunit delta [Sporolactobacillus shoreicorticis]MCO7124872.1 Fe-only nitrogenase subunit delta [Sporolactobacillus shoreicorticis]